MICPNCGRELPDTLRVCPGCSTVLRVLRRKQAGSEETPVRVRRRVAPEQARDEQRRRTTTAPAYDRREAGAPRGRRRPACLLG